MNKKINLNEDGQFLLFRAIVCTKLKAAGFKGDAWEFSGSLDMSFDEVKGNKVNSWGASISKDLQEYKAESPEEFK